MSTKQEILKIIVDEITRKSIYLIEPQHVLLSEIAALSSFTHKEIERIALDLATENKIAITRTINSYAYNTTQDD